MNTTARMRHLEAASIRLHYSAVANLVALLVAVIALAVTATGVALACQFGGAEVADTAISLSASLIAVGAACIWAAVRISDYYTQVAEDRIAQQ